MCEFAGIDGCPAGWICVEQDTEGVLSSRILSRFSDITDNLPDIVCIDIPIGLTDCGPRDCDQLVRKLLKSRGASVFPAPIRAVLAGTSYAAACEISLSLQNKSISKQAFMIYDKILDVDETLCADKDLRSRVFEIHPELSFYGMNQECPMEHSKRDPLGASVRQQLVAEHFGPEAFSAVRNQHRRSVVRDDDILDAFAALWTAQRIARGEAKRVPEPPPIDAEGLPMCMWW